eukprot:TRINITY_DN3497_c0_g1_i1.p2 TRINITY_DN3497_c0_g1~~TRINITY_DN3497_c0_g1_i1.p2  ORF type:complete len:173 (+),score=22.36 TRINITY_DN3497_c0_g1_i1:174-692(+)
MAPGPHPHPRPHPPSPSQARSFNDSRLEENRMYLDHYVIGLFSPVSFQRCVSQDGHRELYAVAFGPGTTNSHGAVQGGAIATLFDHCTATPAFELRGRSCPTKQCAVQFRRPLPVGVCCLELWVEPGSVREVHVRGEIASLPSMPKWQSERVVYAHAHAVLVDQGVKHPSRL